MPAHRTKLNPRQAVFCAEYITDFNATQAAIRAGYASKYAARVAYKMLLQPHIQEAVNREITARAKRTHITQDRVLRELAAVAFFDPRKLFAPDGSPLPINELDDATAAALGGLDVQEVFEGSGENRVFVGYVKKYKVADKNAALSNAMKHLGMLKESLALSGPDGGPVEVNVKQAITTTLVANLKKVLHARRG